MSTRSGSMKRTSGVPRRTTQYVASWGLRCVSAMVTGTKRCTEVLYTVTLPPPTFSRIVSAVALRCLLYPFSPLRFRPEVSVSLSFRRGSRWSSSTANGKSFASWVEAVRDSSIIVKLNRDRTSAEQLRRVSEAIRTLGKHDGSSTRMFRRS
jgi:hypothetical protein